MEPAGCLISHIPRDLWPNIAKYFIPRSATSKDPVTWLCGSGNPEAICTDKQGNVYYIEREKIKVHTPDGLTTHLDCIYEPTDEDPQLHSVPCILFDPAGNLVLIEAFKHQIRKRDPNGLMSVYAGSSRGSDNGPAKVATFSCPVSACYDPEGNLYICDFSNHEIRKISTTGDVSNFTPDTRWSYLSEIVYWDGNLYVLDDAQIKKVFLNGQVKTHIKLPKRPRRCAVDHHGNFLVSDETGLQMVSLNSQERLSNTSSDHQTQSRVEGVHVSQDGNIYMGKNGLSKLDVGGRTGLQDIFEQLILL